MDYKNSFSNLYGSDVDNAINNVFHAITSNISVSWQISLSCCKIWERELSLMATKIKKPFKNEFFLSYAISHLAIPSSFRLINLTSFQTLLILILCKYISSQWTFKQLYYGFKIVYDKIRFIFNIFNDAKNVVFNLFSETECV